MLESVKKFLGTVYLYLKILILSGLILLSIWWYISPTSFYNFLPSFSWWSATLLSDNKAGSIITEVESSGYNIRKVQSIDAFGRVCTDTYANAGTSTDCDYPPVERRDWTIEDYKKLLKNKHN